MNLKISISLIFFTLLNFSLDARHLVGGTAAYQVVNKTVVSTEVAVDFYVLRDETGGGAAFDNPASIGIFGFRNGVYEFLTELAINTSDVISLDLDYGSECPELAYSLGQYSFSVELPNSEYDHYFLSYSRCCRPNDISNITDPEETGFAVTLILYPEAFDFLDRAEALDFKGLPYVVESQELSTFQLGIDDTYEKKYSLIVPFNVGGIAGVSGGNPMSCLGITPNPAECRPPYDAVQYVNADHPFGTGSEIDMDENTGSLNIQVSMLGKFLIGMNTDRFSGDNILLSSVRAQWNFIGSNCDAVLNIEELWQKEIRVVPNPANHSIYSTEALEEVRIMDVSGRSIQYVERMEAFNSLDIQNLKSGYYILFGKSREGKKVRLPFVKSDH